MVHDVIDATRVGGADREERTCRERLRGGRFEESVGESFLGGGEVTGDDDYDDDERVGGMWMGREMRG